MFRDVLNIPLEVPTSTSTNFDGSNRMLQPLRSRKIYFFDPEKSCFPIKKETTVELPVGHFELVTKNANKYFYTEGFEPSGVKGAVVVDANEANYLNEELPR